LTQWKQEKGKEREREKGIDGSPKYKGRDTVECKKNECAYKILVHNISAEISSNHRK
jgi:hypothetical protein